MVTVRTVRERDLDVFRWLHNRFVDREVSPATVRGWYGDHPDLLLGAYADGDLVGHCLGRPGTGGAVRLAGIAVVPDRRRQGIGSRLLAAFEERAASLGYERVSLGSAGGYVDEFYRRNGYEPESVLVRFPAGEVPADYRDRGYDVAAERVEGDTHKLYVDVDRIDESLLADVRETFGDPEAIYVMAKELDPP